MAQRIIPIAFLSVAFCLVVALASAQGIRFRNHTETTVAPVTLVPAVVDPGENDVLLQTHGGILNIDSNGIPGHLVGQFPNSGNPNAITEQIVSLDIPANPKKNRKPSDLVFPAKFGVSIEGVIFDPLAAEFWAGDPQSGWSYNALGGAIRLGLDANYAHVQPNGAYHYHGIPFGLLELAGWSESAHSPLVGYAADGFPIYAMTGIVDGTLQTLTSSYVLKSGERPGGTEPTGAYDGTFNEDFEYVEGAGDLDACNGTETRSAEYPNGTYAYFLTAEYPVVPRCFAGTPDSSFVPMRR